MDPMEELSERELIEQIRKYTNIRNPSVWNGILIILYSILAYTALWQDVKIVGASLAVWALVIISIIATIQSWIFIPLIEKYELKVAEGVHKVSTERRGEA